MPRGRPKKKKIEVTKKISIPTPTPAISEDVIQTKNMDGIQVQDALVK